ncbi:MAG: hypothetical protein M1822_002837 [Bathelium mastoideum]|nr:MAG: hypothetical protein M1822_002837 [Bathelium mastoideum]
MDAAGPAVGIASLGITICQGLLSYYDGWKDYGSDIADARDSITDLTDTLSLLKDSLENGGLDRKRTERVQSCLKSCNSGLTELSKKLEELRKYDDPEGFRQKARSGMQRMLYPFRKETLAKLRGNVGDVRERLRVALEALQLAVQQSDRFRKIIDWLSPPNPWTSHRSARQRYEPQTGSWLLQSDQYQRWKAGAIKHLWISGKAGCGKTVLCSTAIEDVQAHCQMGDNVVLAMFYFSFSDTQKQSYEDLLRSLVAQLAWTEPGLSMLQQAYEKPNRSVPGEDDLEKILLSSVRSYNEVFLVLDALDESPEDGDIRQAMLERVESLTQSASNLKILATSRELRDVRESMETVKAEPISVATSAVDEDIRKYVATQLSRDRRFSRLNSKTTTLIEETISSRADGMFRWAYCQLQELKKLKSTKPRHIEYILRTLPATLDETYERTLSGIEERYRPEALSLLRWLAYAMSPPTLGELAEATIVNPMAGDGEVDTDNRGDLEDTLDILSGLIMVLGTDKDEYNDWANGDSNMDDTDVSCDALSIARPNQRVEARTRVRLAHFSVKEYLESNRIPKSSAKDFYLENAKEHRFLAQSCLTYITYYSNDGGKSSTYADLVAYPLLEYSARSWYRHSSLQEGGDVSREVSLLRSERLKRDWLLIHEPELPSNQSFLHPKDIGSSLYYASYVGLDRVVQALLDAGEEVNAEGGYYGNALQAASLGGHEKVVRVLLDAGAEVNAEGGYYGNALQAASLEGHEKVVRVLLDAGAEVNAEGGYYGNALQAASLEGHEKVVRVLLDAGAEVNAEGGYYGNALQAASLRGHEKVVRVLLDAGAEVNAEGGPYGNALQAASLEGHEKVVRVLLDAVAVGLDPALEEASFYGREKVVQMLLDAEQGLMQGRVHGSALQAASL